MTSSWIRYTGEGCYPKVEGKDVDARDLVRGKVMQEKWVTVCCGLAFALPLQPDLMRFTALIIIINNLAFAIFVATINTRLGL